MTLNRTPAEAAGQVTVAGKSVARIGYGMGSLARAAVAGPERFAAGVELLRHARDLGVTFFDTAQFYENGVANQLLKAAFTDRRDEVTYASKVGARPLTDGPAPMTAAQHPAELRDAVEDNLRALGTDHLDLVYLRRMDTSPGLVIQDGDEQKVALEAQLDELAALREAGTIGAIGLSHVSADQLTRALPYGISAVSDIDNVLYRDHDDVLALCREHGITWSPYFPLGGGFAKLPKVTENDAVRRIATELDATPNQVGLAWVLARSPQALVIAGTSSVEHLEENIGSAGVTLTDEMLRALDAE